MAYGTDNGTMNMAFNGPKTVTPPIVGEARQKATTIINGVLNRSIDLETVPTPVNDACDWIASEWIKNRDTPLGDLVEMAKTLLETIKDDLNSENANRWGTVRFI